MSFEKYLGLIIVWRVRIKYDARRITKTGFFLLNSKKKGTKRQLIIEHSGRKQASEVSRAHAIYEGNKYTNSFTTVVTVSSH